LNLQDIVQGGAYSPPFEGGVAAPVRKRREATEAAQTGWLFPATDYRLLE